MKNENELRLRVLDVACRFGDPVNAVALARDMLAFVEGGETTEEMPAGGSVDTKSARESSNSKPKDAKPKVEETTTPPTAESKTVQLTADGVKAMAVKLVQMEGGKAKLNDLLTNYGAAKFSEVPGDKLVDFAKDLVAAGVPLPA